MYIIKMGKYTCYEKNVFGLNTKMPDNNSEGPIQVSYRSLLANKDYVLLQEENGCLCVIKKSLLLLQFSEIY